MKTPVAEFDRLMSDVAAGSDEAVWKLAEVYTPFIIRAARYSLSSRLRQKLDSVDLAQTLWTSLLLRRRDLSNIKTPEQLIAFLAGATRKKVIEKARHYQAKKCDIRREVSLDVEREAGGSSDKGPYQTSLRTKEPSPSTTAGLRDQWHHILARASSRDREIVRLRLKGSTFKDIAAKLHIDERTARRAMRQLLQHFLE
jgi:RNA polymerase sigma factor (sigma-70 family)